MTLPSHHLDGPDLPFLRIALEGSLAHLLSDMFIQVSFHQFCTRPFLLFSFLEVPTLDDIDRDLRQDRLC